VVLRGLADISVEASMVQLPKYPPLKPLHPDSSLNAAKTWAIWNGSRPMSYESLCRREAKVVLKPARMELYWMDITAFTFCVSEASMSIVFRGTSL
jgi:hypothetical protein